MENIRIEILNRIKDSGMSLFDIPESHFYALIMSMNAATFSRTEDIMEYINTCSAEQDQSYDQEGSILNSKIMLKCLEALYYRVDSSSNHSLTNEDCTVLASLNGFCDLESAIVLISILSKVGEGEKGHRIMVDRLKDMSSPEEKAEFLCDLGVSIAGGMIEPNDMITLELFKGLEEISREIDFDGLKMIYNRISLFLVTLNQRISDEAINKELFRILLHTCLTVAKRERRADNGQLLSNIFSVFDYSLSEEEDLLFNVLELLPNSSSLTNLVKNSFINHPEQIISPRMIDLIIPKVTDAAAMKLFASRNYPKNTAALRKIINANINDWIRTLVELDDYMVLEESQYHYALSTAKVLSYLMLDEEIDDTLRKSVLTHAVSNQIFSRSSKDHESNLILIETFDKIKKNFNIDPNVPTHYAEKIISLHIYNSEPEEDLYG